MSINSSGSVERFTLAAGEVKEYEVQKPGGCLWFIDVHGDQSQSITGVLDAVGTTVELDTAELSAAVAAAKTYGTTNTVTLTAKAAGTPGNSISAQFIDPGANNAALTVQVSGTVILVYYATGSGGAITSLPAQVAAAVNANLAAAALVTATSAGTSAMAAIALAALTGGVDAGPGSYTTVGSAVTVVPGGSAALSGVTGRYAKINNTGSGPAHIVAKPSFRVQPKSTL